MKHAAFATMVAPGQGTFPVLKRLIRVILRLGIIQMPPWKLNVNSSGGRVMRDVILWFAGVPIIAIVALHFLGFLK